MDKCKIAEKVLTYQRPVFICRVKGCKHSFQYRLDYLMHLTEEHSVKDMLEGFKWNISNDEIVIENKNLPGGLKYDDVKKWIDEFGEESVYEKVYFFVEHWDTAKDIVEMVKQNEL